MAVTRLAVKVGLSLALLLIMVQIPVRMLAHAQKANMLAFEVWSGDERDDDIFIADIDHGRAVNLSRAPSSREIRPSWSPDNRLAYISFSADHTEVIVFDLDTMASTPVSGSVRVAIQDSLSWSPNGQLAFMGYDAQGAFITVYVVDGTGNPPVDASPQTRFDDHSVVWLANREIVFVTPGESAGIDLVMLDLDTGLKTMIASDELMNLTPVASPSDNAVIFHAYFPTVHADMSLNIYLWREGQNAQRLFSIMPPSTDFIFTRSFVNGWAVFSGTLGGINDIFLWRMSDQSVLNISNSSALETEAVLSDDGRIAFVDDANARQNVRVYDPHTGQSTLIYSADAIRNLAWSH